MTDALAPCPFCGCSDIRQENTVTDATVWCSSCGAKHQHRNIFSKDDGLRTALSNWSIRAASAPAAVREALDHNGAGKAAEAIFDYCDNNLTMVDACDMDTSRAQQIYDAAELLRDMFRGKYPAVPPAAQTDGVSAAAQSTPQGSETP